MENKAAGARALEGRRPPRIPGLRGGGRGQLWGLELGGGGGATDPAAATPGLRSREVFLAGVGGGETAARCQPERGGATPENR